MDSQEIYLLAELTVLPEFLDDVKGALKQALIPTLQEAGCEVMFETSREGDLHKLVTGQEYRRARAHHKGAETISVGNILVSFVARNEAALCAPPLTDQAFTAVSAPSPRPS